MVEGDFITVKNRTIETDITRNMVGNKMANTVASQVSKVIREESLRKVHPLRKNLLTGKIPNLQLAGRLAHFSKISEKLTHAEIRKFYLW